mmetsp:Transcript_3875/g.7582  ORF Transcript_3875/g.7582 Transcript_3875/m.7582 type:complete len:259 (-) Transcript_3875:159-935(-)
MLLLASPVGDGDGRDGAPPLITAAPPLPPLLPLPLPQLPPFAGGDTTTVAAALALERGLPRAEKLGVELTSSPPPLLASALAGGSATAATAATATAFAFAAADLLLDLSSASSALVGLCLVRSAAARTALVVAAVLVVVMTGRDRPELKWRVTLGDVLLLPLLPPLPPSSFSAFLISLSVLSSVLSCAAAVAASPSPLPSPPPACPGRILKASDANLSSSAVPSCPSATGASSSFFLFDAESLLSDLTGLPSFPRYLS